MTEPIHHLALASDWVAAQRMGEYRTSTIGSSLEQVGFVHASFPYQVRETADRFYRNRDDVVLLTIDPALLTSDLVVEAAAPTGPAFPHVYGPVRVDAVVDARPLPLGADGRLGLGPLEPPVDVEVTLRKATAADVEDLAALQLRTARAGYGHIFPPDAPPPTLERLGEAWTGWIVHDAPARVGLAALHDDLIVAIGLGGPDPDEPLLGHLARLYVDPRYWGLGIGRRVYNACMEHIRRRGHDHATLWVLEQNTRAREWYERLGWVPNGREKVTYAPAGIVDTGYSIDL